LQTTHARHLQYLQFSQLVGHQTKHAS
jgi:hypothetical protein